MAERLWSIHDNDSPCQSRVWFLVAQIYHQTFLSQKIPRSLRCASELCTHWCYPCFQWRVILGELVHPAEYVPQCDTDYQYNGHFRIPRSSSQIERTAYKGILTAQKIFPQATSSEQFGYGWYTSGGSSVATLRTTTVQGPSPRCTPLLPVWTPPPWRLGRG